MTLDEKKKPKKLEKSTLKRGTQQKKWLNLMKKGNLNLYFLHF